MSDDDLKRRARAVMDAIAITRMEGGELSAFVREQLARYVAGDVGGRDAAEPIPTPRSEGRMSEVTYYVALPFLTADDGIAAG
jgi:hypothetical protein